MYQFFMLKRKSIIEKQTNVWNMNRTIFICDWKYDYSGYNEDVIMMCNTSWISSKWAYHVHCTVCNMQCGVHRNDTNTIWKPPISETFFSVQFYLEVRFDFLSLWNKHTSAKNKFTGKNVMNDETYWSIPFIKRGRKKEKGQ